MIVASVGGLFLVLAFVALWQLRDAIRFREWKRAVLGAVLGVLFATASGGALWIAAAHPGDFFGPSAGFPGRDWFCANLGRGGAVFCRRDIPRDDGAGERR